MSNQMNRDVVGVISDRLYGEVEYSADELRLFQTKELERLRQVSLSAVPPWLLPCGVCASKFEHSVGAAYLGKLLGSRTGFGEVERLLYWSLLLHDVGTPPFSHVSEYFLMSELGETHEEFAREMLNGTELSRELERQGADLEQVWRMINGEEPAWGDLVKGSIDLDNLDNSLRFGLSMGLFRRGTYSPESMIEAYILDGEKLVLDAAFMGEIQAWERTRQKVYAWVYSRANLAPTMMLYRALEFAAEEGELGKEYFFMTDEAAYEYLKKNCNGLTRGLMESVGRWQWYEEVFARDLVEVEDELKEVFLDSQTRKSWSDKLAEELGVGREKVSVYLRKDKGYKKIHLPLVSDEGEMDWYEPAEELRWLVRVYVDPELESRRGEVEEFMSSMLGRKV